MSLESRATHGPVSTRYRLNASTSTYPRAGSTQRQPTQSTTTRPTRTDSRTPRTCTPSNPKLTTPHASEHGNSDPMWAEIQAVDEEWAADHDGGPDPHEIVDVGMYGYTTYSPPPPPTSWHLPQPPTTSHVATSPPPTPLPFLFPHYRRDAAQQAPPPCANPRTPTVVSVNTAPRALPPTPTHDRRRLRRSWTPPPRPNNLDRTQYRPPHHPSRTQTPRRPRMASSPS